MLKAVIFDLDDTLIDWSNVDDNWEFRERQFLRGVFDYVNQNGTPLTDFDALIHEFRNGMRDAWDEGRSSLRAPHLGRILVDALVSSGAANAHLDERRCLEAYNWSAAPGVVTFPDVPAALQLLIDHDIRVGIVTNAHQPMWMRDIELAHFGLLDYFPDCRLSAADSGYLKPHPTIFQQALECLGVMADEAVFVGDNPVADVAGAQGAGVRAVLRIRQAASSMLSGLITPDHSISSLEELPAVLDQWFPGWRS
jgi:putative hydrolase of the HAD superfamily